MTVIEQAMHEGIGQAEQTNGQVRADEPREGRARDGAETAKRDSRRCETVAKKESAAQKRRAEEVAMKKSVKAWRPRERGVLGQAPRRQGIMEQGAAYRQNEAHGAKMSHNREMAQRTDNPTSVTKRMWRQPERKARSLTVRKSHTFSLTNPLSPSNKSQIYYRGIPIPSVLEKLLWHIH